MVNKLTKRMIRIFFMSAVDTKLCISEEQSLAACNDKFVVFVTLAVNDASDGLGFRHSKYLA